MALIAAVAPVAGQVPSSEIFPAPALEQQFQSAVSSFDHHQFQQAATQLEALLRAVPQSFEVQELLGLTYGAEALNERAVPHLQAAAALKPNSAVARTNLATGLLRIGNSRQAEIESRKAVNLAPDSYDANHTLAELLLHDNRVADAIPALETAQTLRPGAYDNAYDLALAYLVVGRLPEARQQVDRLSTRQDASELHTLRGRIDESEGKFINAANEFAAAARQDATEDNLFVWGSELLLHRTFAPAIDVFRKATQLYPTSPRLRIGLGMSLYSRGEYEEAVRSLLRAADLNPRDPRCYLFLSKAYLSSPNQAPSVIDHFRSYAALEPDNALAQFYFAMSYWKGLRVDTPDIDYKKIEALLERSIALDGTRARDASATRNPLQ